ncbi:MAG: hypothetical protein WKF89_06720, partial [Chitinophagaceae bacterium]
MFLKGLPELKDTYLSVHKKSNTKKNLWLLTAGKRDGENFTTYSRAVQEFNWTEFYSLFNGESYFEWFREQLNLADVTLIDSRTGVSEMSGVSTRHLANVIVIVTAPNPQNLLGAAGMVKSFINDDVKKVRNNRALDIVMVPSRIDDNESLLKNKFQAQFYRVIDEILPHASGKIFWELGIPYIPYYNYVEELAVGISERPEELENTGKSPKLDKAYRKLSSYLIDGTFESRTVSIEQPLQPYIGLRSFELEDAPLFFGRAHEISRMLEILVSKNFLIISGPPGSGKSSTL